MVLKDVVEIHVFMTLSNLDVCPIDLCDVDGSLICFRYDCDVGCFKLCWDVGGVKNCIESVEKIAVLVFCCFSTFRASAFC